MRVMEVKDCYYIKYKTMYYPVVGVMLDDKDKHEFNDEQCQYMLFGDHQLAQALEPFDTTDKAEIDNQIIYYFEGNVCQRYIKGELSDKFLFKLVQDVVTSW